MKKIFFLITAVLISIQIYAQSPQAFQYQAVVRDASGTAMISQPVNFQISIISGSITGTVVYTETHAAITNSLGVVTLMIGSGTPVTGTFSAITWGTASHFIKVEADPAGGTSYLDMGTTQLLSVPYALYADKSGDAGQTYTSGSGIDLTGNVITNTNPDQTVNISSGTGINVTGTYPNFTIDNTQPDQSINLTGAGSTSVTGTYPNYTITSTGGTVPYTAGTGINISGTTINNTSPDQPVTLTQGGATTITGTYPDFTISSTDNNTTYNAGSGLNLSGTTFTNTAPDQTVTLTQSGATTITGTYPNYTISSTDNNTTYTAGTGLSLTGTIFANTSPDQTVTMTNGAGITITGSYPSFTVTNSSPNATHTGDVTGSGVLSISNDAVTTAKIADGNVTAVKLNSMSATNGQVLKYNGTAWAPAADANTTYNAGTGINVTGTTITNTSPDQTVTISQGGATTVSGTYPNFTVSSTDNNTTYTAGTGMTLTGTTFEAQTSTALWNANQLQGKVISSTAPAANQILKYNGTSWALSADDNTTYLAGTGLSLTGTTFANTAPDQTVAFTNGTGISVTGSYPNFTVTNSSPNANHTGEVTGAGALTIANNAVTTAKIADGNVTYSKLSTATASNGQVLKYNGLAWAPATDDNTTYSAGTGLSLTGTTFANTAPDQTVAFTNGTGISVTGTYPNFTVTNSSPNATHTGDVTGSGALTIANNAVTTSKIADGNVTYAKLSNASASNGQVLKYNGTAWAPASDLNAGTPGGANKTIQYNNSGAFAGNSNFVWDNANERLGIGSASPTGKVVIQGSATAPASEPLFEIKNSAGQQVMAVYPDSVHFFITDVASNKGGFAVSGRNSSKALTNNYLMVDPDKTRIYTGDPALGFGVSDLTSGSNTNYMRLTPANYLIGQQAGKSITSGQFNSFMGYQAGYSTTMGSSNICIGYQAGYSGLFSGFRNNVFIGNYAGYSNSSYSNIFIGNAVGKANTSGYENIYIGDSVAVAATAGQYNTFIGTRAGFGLTTGSLNTLYGNRAGTAVSSGSYNTMIGLESGSTLTTGTNNTFLGYLTGRLNNGTGNVFIGHQAGYNETGNNLLYIDNSTTATPLIGGDFSANRVGINRIPTTYTLEVGGTIWANGATITAGVATWSDERFKTNILTLSNSLENICKLRGVTYNWRNSEFPERNFTNGLQIGVIAQEIEKIYPEVVNTDAEGYKTVSYEKFTPILIEAVKQLNTKVENLLIQNAQLNSENTELKNKVQEIDNLKAEIQKINILLGNEAKK